MVAQLARNWWVLLLRGVIAILFGILAFIHPGITAEVLVLFFGAYMFVDGIFAVVEAVMSHTGHWLALLLEGLLGIAVGVITFYHPGITELALLWVIAGWAIVTGIFEIVTAIRLRKEIQGEFWLVLSGILSVLLGLFIAVFPANAVVGVIWAIGAYAIIFGITLIALAFRLRAWHRRAAAVAGP
jgi:uncharacterized membrane protein HdeD (DUF308 family)